MEFSESGRFERRHLGGKVGTQTYGKKSNHYEEERNQL
jgi:hypothetical protein